MPAHRYRRGGLIARRVVLAGCAASAASRAVAYSPLVSRPVQDPIMDATLDGRLVPVYVGLWAVISLLCLWEMRTGRLIPAMSGWIGMSLAWGGMWFFGWLADPGTTYWQTALTYACPAVMVAALTALTPGPEASAR